MPENSDKWNSGDPYEYFMGRWSQLMAPAFLDWVNFSNNKSWLDVGCGTGALSEAIFLNNNPAHICCIDPSAEFLEKAKAKKTFTAEFITGSADALPVADHSFDIVVSGLALNFFPDIPAALTEIKRVLQKDGMIAAYVWDYVGKMEFLRFFWDAACEADANAAKLDEGNRFPICNADNLRIAFEQAGLTDTETTFLDIDTVFKNFNDYWNPFLGGQGPAPSYLASLNKDLQEKIKTTLQQRLCNDPATPIKLMARAIAVKGKYN